MGDDLPPLRLYSAEKADLLAAIENAAKDVLKQKNAFTGTIPNDAYRNFFDRFGIAHDVVLPPMVIDGKIVDQKGHEKEENMGLQKLFSQVTAQLAEITKLRGSGRLTDERIDSFLKNVGVTKLPNAHENEDLPKLRL